MSDKKSKENYITSRTLPQKTRKWLKTCKPFMNSHRLKKFKFKSKNSLLMIIDMQEYFLNPTSHAYLPVAPVIVPNIKKLLETYHKNNLPVIFTYYAHLPNEKPGIMQRWWGDILYDNEPMAKLISQLRPIATDEIIRKSKYCAFAGTNLKEILLKKKIERLVITGVMTHLCCETTARAAFTRDLEVYFCIDGTATQCEELHINSLKGLADGFAIPITTKEVLDCIEQQN